MNSIRSFRIYFASFCLSTILLSNIFYFPVQGELLDATKNQSIDSTIDHASIPINGIRGQEIALGSFISKLFHASTDHQNQYRASRLEIRFDPNSWTSFNLIPIASNSNFSSILLPLVFKRKISFHIKYDSSRSIDIYLFLCRLLC